MAFIDKNQKFGYTLDNGLSTRESIHRNNLRLPKSIEFDQISKSNIDANTTTLSSSYPGELSNIKNINNNQEKSNKIFQSMYKTRKDKDFFETLEQMAVPFEELQKLLINNTYLILPYYNIQSFLICIIMEALKRPNPVDVMKNNLTYYTRQYYRDKLINFVAKSMNIDFLNAMEFLKVMMIYK